MKIAIPLFAIKHKLIGGTESAIYNQISGLAALEEVDLHLFEQVGQEFAPEQRIKWTNHSNITLHGLNIAGSRLGRFYQESVFSISHPKVDAVIYPNYFSGISSRRAGVRLSVLHDIQYKSLPNLHSAARRNWLDFYLPSMFKYNDKVAVISETEKSLVQKFFGQRASDKCVVIPNAIDWSRYEFNGRDKDRIGLEVDSILKSRFIVSVAHPYPHKNISTLVKAFELLAKDDSEINLVFVGMPNEKMMVELKGSLLDSIAARVLTTGFVTDSQLGRLYRKAQIVAIPSLYEGFGMPAVEALGLGTRVVVSNNTAMPETTLGLGSYVDDVLDPVEWAEKIKEQMNNSPLGLEAIEKVRQMYHPRRVGEMILNAIT